MSNFDDMALAVASFGGNNKVIFDDLGKPSIMVGVPKMKYSDIIADGPQEVLPWWIVDSKEISTIWVSKFINTVVNERAYSLPMKDPKCYINYDAAIKACTKKGAGWHLNQGGVFAALVLRAEKRGTIPRGNTNWDASYEKAWERGINTYIDGSKTGGRTATGSGPVTWYDDWTAAGIADLCGDTWEIVGGQRLNNGEINIIADGNSMKSTCSMAADSTEWKAIMPDGTLVEPGTEGTLKYDLKTAGGTPMLNTTIENQSSGEQWPSTPFKNLTVKDGVAVPKILIAAGFFPETGMTSPGQLYVRNDGERVPYRGSAFRSSSYGGPAALTLHYTRTSSNSDISFRSAYYE